jgi:hypothetical protein
MGGNYIAPPSSIPVGSIVDAYLRDSGGEGQDRSIQSQLLEIQSYCELHKLKLRRIYKDVAKSGRNMKGRSEFNRMIEDYRSGLENPRGLLIWDYARFGRNAKETNYGIVTIEHHGVAVHSLVDDIPEGPYKEVFRSVKNTGNQSQSDSNSHAIIRMQHQLVRLYKAMFGIPPRGIMREPLPPVINQRTGEVRILHKWVPDPAMRGLVLRAFEMRDADQSIYKINKATGLYKSVGCYAEFFSNKIYIGVLEFGGETFEEYCDPIVPRDLWDRVNAKAKQMRPGDSIRHARRLNSPFLLSGLLFCQECSAVLKGHKINGWMYYICPNRKQSGRCAARHVPKKKIEEEVLAVLREKVLHVDYLVATQLRAADHIAHAQEDIELARVRLGRDLKKAEKEIANFTRAIGKHGDSPSLMSALRDAEASHAILQVQLSDLNFVPVIPHRKTSELKEIADQLTRIIDTGSDDQKRIILRSIVTKVIARKDDEGLRALVRVVPLQILKHSARRSALGLEGVPLRGFEPRSWP